MSQRVNSADAKARKGTRIRWAIVGTGFMARNRMVPAIRSTEDSEIVAVASGTLERAKAFAQANEIPAAYGSVEAMLADDAIDAVYVGSTNDKHATHVIAAAAAGRNVLCEKPLAMSLDEAIAMHDACSSAGVVFGTNHYHRLKPSHVTIRRLIREGAIGAPLVAQLTFGIQLAPEQRTWRLSSSEAGGGVVRDLTVHDADIVRALFDGEVVDVLAVASKRGSGQGALDDSVAGVMRMSSGVLLSFLDSYVIPNAVHALAVLGSEGSIVADSVFRSDSDGTVTLRRDGTSKPVELPVWENPFRLSVRAFNNAIRGIGQPAVTGVDGIKSLAVALAVLKSAEAGCLSRVTDVDSLLAVRRQPPPATLGASR